MMSLAMPASRSLIALLVGTVAFFALWLVALKPGSSNGPGGSSSSQGLGQYQSDINKAHQAVGISNASNAASGNDGTASSASSSTAPAAVKSASTSQTSSSSSKPAARAASSTKPAPHLIAKVGAHNPAALARISTVQTAMADRKVVAMLFYNPLGADDQAVKQQLNAVPGHRGQVVKLTIPLGEAANFTAVTQRVPVNFSPTLVLIARSGAADEIVGYSDRFEIAQRVIDALATH